MSAVPDEQSGEVGGIQNTGTQLGASIGTALAGAVLISALTASFLTGVQNNPAVPDRVAAKAQTNLAGGVPFISDADLKAALSDAHVPREDSRRDRADKRAEPDRRAARRRLDPRTLRARRPAVHARHPDSPTRRPNQAQLSADIAMSSAATSHPDRARSAPPSSELPLVEHPFIYEINTWVWLDELGRRAGKTIGLAERARGGVGRDRGARASTRSG